MVESRLFETLFDVIPFGVYVVDVDTYELVYMNRFLVERYGAPRSGLCWQTLYQLDRPCAGCKISRLIDRKGRPNGETHVFEQFNEVDEHWYQMQEKCISWPDGRTVKYSIAVDISDLKTIQNSLAEAHAMLALKNRELERLSSTDRLTGLYNRLRLDEALAKELARAARYESVFSVILLDVDHFKAVNDSHGHQAGDQVLVRLSQILQDHRRVPDVVGRWGGEEFLIVCPETDGEGAAVYAEQLRAAIAGASFPTVGHKTASFGVATYRPGDNEKELVRRADEALYQAKEAGRDRVVSA